MIKITKLRYSKRDKKFNLVDYHKKYVTYPSRKEEIIAIDDWLMKSGKEVNITFTDAFGTIHNNLKVDTSKMQTWFDGADDFGDYKTFTWEFPTEVGSIYIHGLSGKCRLNKQKIKASEVIVSVK